MQLKGWAVHLTRCPHFDKSGSEAYAINLVFPWGAHNPGDPPPFMVGNLKGPAITGTTVCGAPHEWCNPWRWDPEQLKWALFGEDSNNKWVRINTTPGFDSGSPAWNAGVAQKLTAGIDGFVRSEVAQCENAFSIAIDEAGLPGSKSAGRSIPHVLAPLTHWPAYLSNALLRFGGFLSVDISAADAHIGRFERIVCFPQFNADGVRFDADSADLFVTDRVQARYGNNSFAVVCNATSRKAAALPAAAPVDANGPLPQVTRPMVSQDAVRALFAARFMPLQIRARGVARYLEARGNASPGASRPNPDPLAPWEKLDDFLSQNDPAGQGARAAWRAALWRAIPNGWSERYVGAGSANQRKRIHVLQYFVAPDDRVKLGSALDQSGLPGAQDDWPCGDDASFLATLQTLRNAASNDPNSAGARRWTGALDNWKTLDMPDEQAGMTFLERWLNVARALIDTDGSREIIGPWMQTIFDPAMKTSAASDVWKELLSPASDRPALSGLKLPPALATRAALGKLDQIDNSIVGLMKAPPLDVIKLNAWMNGALARFMPTSGTPMPQSDALSGTEIADAAVDALQNGLARHGDPEAPRAHDRGITLAFDSAAQSSSVDQQIRGYAIALASGLQASDTGPWLGDFGRAQWITDAALWFDQAWVEQSPGSGPVWVHECVGSTLQNGVRVVSAEYRGQPLCALAADAKGHPQSDDAPGAASAATAKNAPIEFRWGASAAANQQPNIRSLPLLGYGQYYKSTATCIDNAGGIIEPALRDPARFSSLLDASAVFQSDAQRNPPLPVIAYRSCVPPGPPVISVGPSASAYEVSPDTRAHAYQLQLWRASHVSPDEPHDNALKPVALLTHKDTAGTLPVFSRINETFTLKAIPPSASGDFIARWLNTDILVMEFRGAANPPPLGALKTSDSNFDRGTPADLFKFRELLMGRFETRAGQASLGYHPAVSNIGVAVWFDDNAAPFGCYVMKVDRTRVLDTGELAVALETKRTVSVVVSLAAGADPSGARSADGQVSVTLARGGFARVRLFSLIEESYFNAAQGSMCRFAESLGMDPKVADPWLPTFGGYRAFSPVEYWFEAAPAWPATPAPGQGPDRRFDFALKVETASESDALGADRARLVGASFAPFAHWVRALHVERHEWHWTGYPVSLPALCGDAGTQAMDLRQWVTSFTGVESYCEEFDVTLPTRTKGTAWSYDTDAGGEIMLRALTLAAGPRPARYATFFAQPLIRFEGWVNPKLVESGPWQHASFATGSLIAGRPPSSRNDRLPTPTLRLAVPLTMNYRGTPKDTQTVDPAHPLEREANGNLLCFDDVLRRTDDQATSGGIGDTLEIDVVATRDETHPQEFGVNPIFHGCDSKSDLQLVVHEPFGLTYDISSNAKVAQTAYIATPLNGEGKWLMSMVQARRLILPETQLANRLREVAVGGAPTFDLPCRTAGNDMVPMDFAIDTEFSPGPWDLKLTITAGPQPLQLHAQIPALSKDAFMRVTVTKPASGLRFLCSWHKGEWASPNPLGAQTLRAPQSWRMQILVQYIESGVLPWRTLQKVSCFSNTGTELSTHLTISQASLTLPPSKQAPIVREVWMSDYNDPFWLTFIGSFGAERISTPGDYLLSGDSKTLTLSAVQNAALPQLHGPAESEPCFHVLLVFKGLDDAIVGDHARDGGALVAVFVANGGGPNFAAIDVSKYGPAPFAPTSLTGCCAYLVSVQKITSTSKDERAKLSALSSFETMVENMFPPENMAPSNGESLLRVLPEYLGPLAITS